MVSQSLILSLTFHVSSLYFPLQASSKQDVVINMDGVVDSGALSMEAPYEITKVLHPTPADRRFKQELSYNGGRLVLRTDFISTESARIIDNQYGKYVSIPVSNHLRQQLDKIEDFVTKNISIPSPLGETWRARDDKDTPYRKIWDGETLYVSLSNWVKLFRQDTDYMTEIPFAELGIGFFQICITISGVYYGRHKDNKLASISMLVNQLLYKPFTDDVDAIINDILSQESAVKHAKRKRKAKNN